MVTTLKPRDTNPRLKALYVGTPNGLSGLLAKESQHVFTYAAEAVVSLDQRKAIALSMPVVAESYQSSPIFPVFQTSLPEGFLKERIVERFSKTMRIDDMALVALSGGSRIGRLRLSTSEEMPANDLGSESLKDILQSEGSQNIFQDLCDKYLITPSGISGVQPKVVLSADDDVSPPLPTTKPTTTPNAKLSIGAKSTLRGKQLIIKTAGDDYPGLAENEFHCLSIAQKAGLSVPPFWLSEDKKRLAVQRFDIDDATGELFGFEDMVSLQGKVNDEKYEGSCENVALAIKKNASPELAYASLKEFFESIVLSVIVRNGDAHLKNFGLLYTDPSSDDCRLSPLFDVVCTTMYLPRDQMALKLAKSKSWPDRKTLVQFGRQHCRVEHAGTILDRIADAASEYQPEDSASELWRQMRSQIETGLQSIRA
ncbi:MAG: type II toxin-antitoxin system HipA family toxin [Burkholderiales bacterium]